MILDGIKNLIFDFGGVLYEINTDLSLSGFLGRSINKSMDSGELIKKENFHLFEKGIISTTVFRDNLRNLINSELTDEEIDRIWNLTLIKPFEQSSVLISYLRGKYKLALLSNTNEIHYNHFKNQVNDIFDKFDFLFFSYMIKLRKPEREIYKYLLDKTGFLPEETLFLDDSTENIDGAKLSGLKTYLVTDPTSLWEIFHSV